MELSIIKIGNSKGIRLPKFVLEKYNLADKLELILDNGQIVLRPIGEPRKGWDKAFQKMHDDEEDRLLLDDVFDEESFDEWN